VGLKEAEVAAAAWQANHMHHEVRGVTLCDCVLLCGLPLPSHGRSPHVGTTPVLESNMTVQTTVTSGMLPYAHATYCIRIKGVIRRWLGRGRYSFRGAGWWWGCRRWGCGSLWWWPWWWCHTIPVLLLQC
jgi:hypothetical protein